MSTADWFVSSDPDLLHLDTVYPWLRDCYWSPGVRRDVVERAFANSLFVGAYTHAAPFTQLGVARAVTDYATFAWLCDVFVAPDARGRGIARALVRTLMSDTRLRTLRRWALGTRDAHGVYAPLGFGPVDPAIWMEHRPDMSAWSDRTVTRP